jgi:hypothetical protein
MMTKDEAQIRLLKLWEKHPYDQTLSDYYLEDKLWRVINAAEQPKKRR